MSAMKNALEDYWMDEEKALRKRGIDPMTVDQIIPPVLPTHKHSPTLHRGKTKKATKFKKGGLVQGFSVSDSDWRRNKAREVNEGSTMIRTAADSLAERTKYAKK